MDVATYPYACTFALGGVPLRCRLRFAEAVTCFAPYAAEAEPVCDLAVTEEEWAYMARHDCAMNGQNEASLITALASDVLLQQDRCILHAVALRHADRAWLITAPSGVGKSTQARTLNELYPGQFSVICGDRPVLELRDGDSVFVHPSPWNGKEGWHGADGAPLAGIVCLRRGQENDIRPLSARDAVIPVLHALIHTGRTAEAIRRTAAFEDALLRRTRVWELVNRGVPDSTRLLYETLFA